MPAQFDRRDLLKLTAAAGMVSLADLSAPTPSQIHESTFIDVTEYGARGDGETEDTEAFQRAYDESPDGAVVYVPPGDYPLRRVEEPVRKIPPGAIITTKL